MDNSSVFSCDETPTPTRFIRNCEEVGLFQDLQHVNPFEETFRSAISSKNDISNLLQDTLSRCINEDTLNTPHVIPSAKNKNTFDVYPMTEDDEDVIIIPDSDLLKCVLPDDSHGYNIEEYQNDDGSCDIEVIETVESNIPTFSASHVETSRKLDLISNDEDEMFYYIQNSTVRNQSELCKKKNLASTDIKSKDSVIDFLICNKKVTAANKNFNDRINFAKTNSVKSICMPNSSELLFQVPVSHVPAAIGEKNVFLLSPKNSTKNADQNIISFQESECAIAVNKTMNNSILKQKLKNFLETSNRAATEPAEDPSKISKKNHIGSTVDDEKREYSRERNRMAQKRCRMKKKRWILQLKKEFENLSGTIKKLESERNSYKSENISLRAENANLKTLIMAHKNCSVTRAMFKATVSSLINDESSKISDDILIPAADDDDNINLKSNCEKQNGSVVIQNIHHHHHNHHSHHKQVLRNPRIHVNVPNDISSKKLNDVQNKKLVPRTKRAKKDINSDINLKRKLIFDTKLVPILSKEEQSKDEKS